MNPGHRSQPWTLIESRSLSVTTFTPWTLNLERTLLSISQNLKAWTNLALHQSEPWTLNQPWTNLEPTLLFIGQNLEPWTILVFHLHWSEPWSSNKPCSPSSSLVRTLNLEQRFEVLTNGEQCLFKVQDSRFWPVSVCQGGEVVTEERMLEHRRTPPNTQREQIN